MYISLSIYLSLCNLPLFQIQWLLCYHTAPRFSRGFWEQEVNQRSGAAGIFVWFRFINSSICSLSQICFLSRWHIAPLPSAISPVESHFVVDLKASLKWDEGNRKRKRKNIYPFNSSLESESRCFLNILKYVLYKHGTFHLLKHLLEQLTKGNCSFNSFSLPRKLPAWYIISFFFFPSH